MSDKLNWFEVDEGSLSKSLREQMKAAIEAKRNAAQVWEKFHTAFLTEASKAGKVPAGKQLVLIYKFGKVSVAVADGKAKSSGGSKPKFSF